MVYGHVITRKQKARIWDLDGNKYLDMSIGGIGATILGYADKHVDNAVKNQLLTVLLVH